MTSENLAKNGLSRCQGCQHMESDYHTDKDGNIHISWTYKKKNCSIYFKTIRSERYLQQFPYEPKEESAVRPNLDNCKEYYPKSYSLTYFPKRE